MKVMSRTNRIMKLVMNFRSISDVFSRKINKKPCLYQQGQLFYMECLISALVVPLGLLPEEQVEYSLDGRLDHAIE